MQAAADYYATLGVAPEAQSDAIRAAYRNLMRRHHPDVNPSDDAAARATQINEAYDCLGNPDKRAAYDRQRAWGSEQSTFTAGFGTGTAAAPRRSNWQPHHVRRPLDPDPIPRKWSRAILGLATALTAFIFAITSATPPPMPLPEPAVALVPGVVPSPEVEQDPCASSGRATADCAATPTMP